MLKTRISPHNGFDYILYFMNLYGPVHITNSKRADLGDWYDSKP